MSDDLGSAPALRIERALARIEGALAGRAAAHDRLARRHAALRARVEEAVAAIDGLIAAEPDEQPELMPDEAAD